VEPDVELGSYPVTDAIHATNLFRFFHVGDDETVALRGVDLAVAPGEFVAVMGPSGSGKSTLLSCLAGLDNPDGGSVEIAGERITRRTEVDRCRIRARSIGIMMQAGNLFAHLSVIDNLRLQRNLARLPATKLPETLLTELGLGGRMNALPSTLSGGESARAGLAVAMAAEPAVLICDEPTAEIDSATEAVVIATIKRLQTRGSAILVATHSQALAERADRVLKIVDGQLA
jgi:putative ABC transport system ATP-binding protein